MQISPPGLGLRGIQGLLQRPLHATVETTSIIDQNKNKMLAFRESECHSVTK